MEEISKYGGSDQTYRAVVKVPFYKDKGICEV